jgi:hypothetical protein
LGRLAAVEILPRGNFREQAAMSQALVNHGASPWVFLVVTKECRTIR